MTNTQIARVNFILDNEEMDFTGYEFVTFDDVYIEETEDEQSLFRLNVYKDKGEFSVYCAYSEDFDLMEDVTDLFDTEKLFEDIKKKIEEQDGVDNLGEEYIEYYKLKDDGWDCDDAMYEAQRIVEARHNKAV